MICSIAVGGSHRWPRIGEETANVGVPAAKADAG